MKRYSKKTLKNMTCSEFVCDILQHEMKDHKTDSAVFAKMEACIAHIKQDSIAHISYPTLATIFRMWERNAKYTHLSAYITFTENSFAEKNISLARRTYRVSSDNKGYQPNAGTWSDSFVSCTIYGDSLDGTDVNCPLHEKMAAEQGGKRGWRVQYCQLVEEEVM